MAGFAWVTLATNDSYSLGALVLAHSLRRVGSKHDLAVLVTPGVTGAMREKLASVFTLVQEVNVLDSKDEANLALLARPELGITFTKLHCWRLTQYEKCVFVDADTLVIRNCDELFEREELSAAPDVGWPDCFNSGVFVFKPSQQTFASITEFAAAKGSFDGGDQGLLNQYFSDWAHKDISKHLPFIYNMCSTATYSYLPAFKQFGEDVRIIHFIGITKPWLQYFDTLSGQVQPAPGSNHLQPLLQLWWHIFCENVHPKLSSEMTSSTLAPVWHEFNSFSSISSQPRHHNVNDLSYNNIPLTEPDFSEFQDPWNNYSQESNHTTVPILAIVESSNDHYQSSEYSDTNNFSFGETDIYCHEQQSPHQIIVHHQLDSHNDTLNKEIHYSPNHLSVLDDSSNKTHDNYQINCPTEEISHCQVQNTSQNQNNHRDEDYCNKDSNHQEYYHHEQNDHQEQNYYHSKHVNYCKQKSDDKSKNVQHVQQDQYLDNLIEEIHQRLDDHIHHEEDKQQHFNNHNFDVFDTDLQSIHESSFKNCDEKSQNDENRLQDNSNIDNREKQTDVCSTNSYSTTESKTKSQSPPESCPKSKSIATQSESQLESNDAGIAGALAKITLGEARSPEQVAFEEHMRKQSWEQGQIDYMGRDSFDNIWKKISETLAVTAPRQPSPPKTVPKLEKSEVDVAVPVEIKDGSSTKTSEAAVLAEPQQKEVQDLTCEIAPGLPKLIPLSAQFEKEIIPVQSSSSDAAVKSLAFISIDSELSGVKTLESTQKNDKESSVFTATTTTTTTDSSILQPLEVISHDVKLDEVASTDLPKIPAATILPEETQETKKDVKPEDIQLPVCTSTQIISDSPVPIQVAESVLEAEVKESVTEDLRPVTEEAISSISDSPQEPIPAVLETTVQAVSPPTSTPNGSAVLDPILEIGNGIDALNFSPPIRVTTTAVAVARGIPEVVASPQLEEIRPARLETSQETAASGEEKKKSPIQVATDETKVSTETQDSVVPAAIIVDAQASRETVQSRMLGETLAEPCPKTEKSSSSVQFEKKIESELPSVIQIESQCSAGASQNLQTELPGKIEEPKILVAAVSKSEVPVKSEEVPSVILKREQLPSSTKSEEIVTCPMKPEKKAEEVSVKSSLSTQAPSVSESNTDVADSTKASVEKKVPKVQLKKGDICDEMVSQSESSEESPVRPARTKEMQIPGTPTVIEATPPTSPPIGALEAFEEQPSKTTKKVVKKVVKKSTSTETKPVEGAEAEADVKKVTKKVVKKVVKKTKEDDTGVESSSVTEKPKKIVKVVKKTTKAGPTLEANATVPETPPPGISEIPVPPKRKLKTTGKLTPAKSDSEP